MGFMQAPPSGDGNFKVFVKFNAKAGRWYTKEDEKDAPEFEVTNMTAIFDMENLKTGWFLFASNQAPVKHFDPGLDEAAAKPGDNFKRGFELDIFSEKNLHGVREFASTAGVAIEAMNELYDDWIAGKKENPGKLPVVKCVGVQPIVGAHGTNYKPQFEIVSWADRPEELDEAPPPKAETKAAAKAEHAPPPAAKEPVAADDDVDF